MTMKRWLAALLALVMLLSMGISTALAVPVSQINTSSSISFSSLVKKYRLTYDGNGASGTIPAVNCKSGEKITVKDSAGLTAPAGKVFAGWTTVKGTSVSYVSGDQLTITADTTLYAVWSDSSAAITLTLHNPDTGATKTVAAVSGQSYVLPTLTSLGWTPSDGKGFDGWGKTSSTADLGKAGVSIKVDASVKDLYAVFSASGTVEFPATVKWNDENDHEGYRPLSSEFISKIILRNTKADTVVTTAPSVSGTDGDEWKLVWTGLPKDGTYVMIVPKVDEYSIQEDSKADLVTYNLLGSVSMSMWITNKKWDKNGNLIKFKAGQTVRFRMDIHNAGNQTVYNVNVWEDLKNAKFKKADRYKIIDGCAFIGELGPHDTVSVWATYRVTNSDARKEKVVNVVGVDYQREKWNNSTWGSDWAAVRIPIKRGSTTSSGSAATPVPTATPTPLTGEEIVSKLVKDITTNNIAYPNGKIEIVGAQEILTPEEYAIFRTLNTQDQMLTVLNTVGFEKVVPMDIQRYSLTVTDTAKNLMNSIQTRKASMSDVEAAEFQAQENIYFPHQQVTVNGVAQNYFEASMKFTNNARERIDRYTFRQDSTGEWLFVRLVTAQ